MMNWIRTRTLALVVTLLTVALLAGCGTKEPAKAAEAAPAPAPAAQTCPECPKVDKVAIANELAKQYFNTMPTTYHQIDAAELKKKVDAKDPTLYLVDIRKAEDFEKQWVDGFINMPFLTLGQTMDKLPKDKQIVISCYTGQTAGQAIAALRMAGYNAITVKFGWNGIVDSKAWEIKKK